MANGPKTKHQGTKAFKAELKIKPLPAGVEEYAKQYFINLILTGHLIIAPDGAIMNKDNIKQAMEAWG